MFLRFRPIKSRLYVSLVSSTREAITVRLEHHAALGSVALKKPGALERAMVWQRLHDTVTRLGISGHTARALAEALENRIPRPIEAKGLLPEPFAITARAARAAPDGAPPAVLATTARKGSATGRQDISKIAAKLRPLIKRLKAQGRTNMVTMSPPIVAGLARELERILPTVLATTSRKHQPESIRLLEVDAKLASLLEELKQQGRANMATMSPAAVFMIAGQLENLLDELEGSPHG